MEGEPPVLLPDGEHSHAMTLKEVRQMIRLTLEEQDGTPARSLADQIAQRQARRKKGGRP